MFFWFPPLWDKNTDYEYSNENNHKKFKSKDISFDSDDHFVYSETDWREETYQGFSSPGQTFDDMRERYYLDFIEETNNVVENDFSKIEKLIETSNNISRKKIISPPGLHLFSIVDFFYSPKTVKEVFKQTLDDWHEEYFEALFKKEFLKARWINVRYTYAFFAAMWQKSPIGDFIEFISKIAK